MSSRLEELERQHHILSVLYQVYGEMSGAATLDDAVKKLLQYARQEAGAQTRGFCAVLDDEGALAQVRASTEEDGKAARGTTIDLLASPLRALIGLGGLHVLEEREALRPFLPGTKSQLILPISHDGAPVAFLDLEAREPGAFARVDGYFFEKLAEQAGTILHTRNDLSRSQKEIDLLWDVGAVADASQELDQSELPDLLAKVLEIALGRLRVKNGTIFLVDEDTGDLIVESRSLRGDFLKKAPLRLKRRRGRPSGIAFWVVEHNKPYATGNIDKDPNYAPLFRGIRSNVAVPIPFQDRAIGAIVLESVKGDAFTSEDVRVLEEPRARLRSSCAAPSSTRRAARRTCAAS
ncbi:MAG: GAF domain-containing protein [Acidobacteriota bacterium]